MHLLNASRILSSVVAQAPTAVSGSRPAAKTIDATCVGDAVIQKPAHAQQDAYNAARSRGINGQGELGLVALIAIGGAAGAGFAALAGWSVPAGLVVGIVGLLVFVGATTPGWK